MKAILLAAGRGKRLRPLTDLVAKGLLPVGGRPIIEQIIENLRATGIEEIVVVTGHLGDQIKAYLGDGSKYGVKIFYREQRKPLGMAHALRLGLDFIEGYVLVSACDSLSPEDHYRELLQRFREEDLDAALSLKVMGREEIKESSVVKLEEDGSISRIIEKPSEDEIISNIACAPLYVFREGIKEYLPKVKKSKRGEYEIQDAIQSMIDDGLRVKGVLSGSWIHLSDIRDFLRLNFGYTKRYFR